MNTLAQKTALKENCFDFIRLVAAIIVVLSHSFDLLGVPEPYKALTVNMSLGYISVLVFFVISGFLITKSWVESTDALDYSLKRFLRIVPALFVVVVLTIFFVGPIATDLKLSQYFLSISTWKYLVDVIPVRVIDMPHVFMNHEYHLLNGSLWSLALEFHCYIGILFLGASKFFKQGRKFIFLALILFIAFCLYPQNTILSKNLAHNSCYAMFGIGSLLYVFRDKIILNKYIALFITVLLALTYNNPSMNIYTHMLAISYLTFYVAYNAKFLNNIKNKIGDLSYGTYIYAFPVQQILILYFFNSLNPLKLFIISTSITLVFAIMSWFLVEKHTKKHLKGLRNLLISFKEEILKLLPSQTSR